MATAGVLGFVGLGVMGEPMCRNLARKSGATVVAFDERPAQLSAVTADGVQAATSVAEVAHRAEIVFLCLPGEPQVRAVCLGGGAGGGLAALVEPGQTVVALAEAHAVARASGAVDPRVLFETLAKGSADSFVLRNHGMKSLLPDRHPTEGAFPTRYILKDLSYAIQLAESAGVRLEQAATTRRLLEATAATGWSDAYFTAVIRTIEKR